jgi:transcriptional regulator with XRE-family HTH domain
MPAKHIAINVNILKTRIGENIEQVRLQKKVSIKEMAQLLNLTYTAYRNIERGKTAITVIKIFQIAALLDVNFFLFLDLENSISLMNSDNTAKDQTIETLKSTLQHYKDEITFLRRQLELLNTQDIPAFKNLKPIR